MKLDTYTCAWCLAAIQLSLHGVAFGLNNTKIYEGCEERWAAGERKPGLYDIYPDGKWPIKVYCNHNLESTATLMQQRVDGSESFVRSYADYVKGFGDPHGNYWVGLAKIAQISRMKFNRLVIYMTDWAGVKKSITYAPFTVLQEPFNFRVRVGYLTGNPISNDLAYIDGSEFYTYDRPDYNGCVFKHQGAGWWYNATLGSSCTNALLNGKYYKDGIYKPTAKGCYDGIFWAHWKGANYSMKHVVMQLWRI